NGPDGGQRMPVVRRGDAHDVDRLVLERLPHVLVDGRLRPLFLGDGLSLRIPHPLVDVDDGHDLGVLPTRVLVDVLAPPAADADAAPRQPFARLVRPFEGGRGTAGPNRHSGGGRQHRLLEEFTARRLVHGAVPPEEGGWAGSPIQVRLNSVYRSPLTLRN